MIDRKTLWFMILAIAAMCAASFWRLGLAPDWAHVPFIGDNGRQHTKNGIVLFIGPLSLVLVVAVSFLARRLVSGSAEAIAAYQRNNRIVLLGTGVLGVLMHAFLISRSLGAGLGLNGQTLSRLVIGITGLLIMMQGNNLPKLPWVTSRCTAFQLDAWQSARLKRISGFASITYGLIMVAAAALVPVSTLAPLVMGLVPIYLGTLIWTALRLKREPSLMPREKNGVGA
jgi:hypothetical protein